MKIRKWIEENIIFQLFGCHYTVFHKPLFDFIESKIPEVFLEKEISDLGCGDGTNTLRIKRVFRAKDIIGYDYNDSLLERANRKGISVQKLDLNKEIPKGEMAIFMLCLHHLENKDEVLRKATENFDYLFLAEPIKNLYITLFHAPGVLIKQEWIVLFNKVLKKYTLYQFKNRLIVFWQR